MPSPSIEVYSVRTPGPANIGDHCIKQVSLPFISAMRSEVEEPPRLKLIMSLPVLHADNAARIATIRSIHRRMVRAGMFDHCEGARS